MAASSSPLILLRGARQLLSLHGSPGPRRGAALNDLAIIPDGAVLMQDGKILAVGTSRRLENLKIARGALEIDAQNSVILPGFVDPDISADLPLDQFEPSLAPQRQVAKIRNVYDENLRLLRLCLQHGTVTAEIKASASQFGEGTDIPLLRRIASIGNNPVSVIRTWRLKKLPASTDEIAEFTARSKIIVRRKLARYLEITLGEESVLSPDFLQAIRESRLSVKMRWTGLTQRSMAPALELLEPSSVICSPRMFFADTDLAARYEGSFVFSPGPDPRQIIGRGIRTVVDAGAAIALSSGYDANEAPGFSMQMAISLPVVRGELTIEEAVSAATVNAAYAVGEGERIGTLEVGKRADILVLMIRDYRQLHRQLGINHVGMVFRAGELVQNRTTWRIGTHGSSSGRMRS